MSALNNPDAVPSYAPNLREPKPQHELKSQQALSAITQLTAQVVPPAARASLRNAHRRWTFRHALERFARDPERALNGSDDLLHDLIYGWGNEGWSGQPEYLRACISAALATNGAILECGSGLSTVLLGLAARTSGASVWSLEHLPQWARRVEAALRRHRIRGVRILVAPLVHYDGYDWYAAPLAEMPEQFHLIVCDGPPATTRGGRYGLLPVMRDRLAPGCLILADDADREAEQLMVHRWAHEMSCAITLLGAVKPYFALSLAR